MPTQDKDRESTVIQGKICDRDNICDCLTVGELDPCAIVIFGASGDLTARKLIPAPLTKYSTEGFDHVKRSCMLKP